MNSIRERSGHARIAGCLPSPGTALRSTGAARGQSAQRSCPMAESVEAPTPRLATELPSKYLPAVGYRDLPEPQGLRKYMGASIILTATALGSGELVLWPYITTQVGLGIVWLAVVGITMQFFLNMEIERYTLITG